MELKKIAEVTNGRELYLELEGVLREDRYQDIYGVLDLVVDFYEGLGESANFEEVRDWVNYELTEETPKDIASSYDLDIEDLDDEEILDLISYHTLVLGFVGEMVVYVPW